MSWLSVFLTVGLYVEKIPKLKQTVSQNDKIFQLRRDMVLTPTATICGHHRRSVIFSDIQSMQPKPADSEFYNGCVLILH